METDRYGRINPRDIDAPTWAEAIADAVPIKYLADRHLAEYEMTLNEEFKGYKWQAVRIYLDPSEHDACSDACWTKYGETYPDTMWQTINRAYGLSRYSTLLYSYKHKALFLRSFRANGGIKYHFVFKRRHEQITHYLRESDEYYVRIGAPFIVGTYIGKAKLALLSLLYKEE